MNIINLEIPSNFNFSRTVFSHGWYQLLPFEFDSDSLCLNRIFQNSEKSVSAAIYQSDGNIEVKISDNNIDQKFKEQILREVRHILRLDDDLNDFYQLTKKKFSWISETNSGRLLRSPTVFEDLIKTICTTNCSWALTKNMTKNLVEKLGTPTAGGKKSFPTAIQMASVSTDFYKTEIRAGYRAAYFAELAEKVAAGKINPEGWLNSELPTKELKKEMKQIKGVGDYAAENLLKLVGRYEGLALDSFLRSEFYKKHNKKTVCGDREIEDFYEKFGSWRGLVMWCDMTESH